MFCRRACSVNGKRVKKAMVTMRDACFHRGAVAGIELSNKPVSVCDGPARPGVL